MRTQKERDQMEMEIHDKKGRTVRGLHKAQKQDGRGELP